MGGWGFLFLFGTNVKSSFSGFSFVLNRSCELSVISGVSARGSSFICVPSSVFSSTGVSVSDWGEVSSDSCGVLSARWGVSVGAVDSLFFSIGSVKTGGVSDAVGEGGCGWLK